MRWLLIAILLAGCLADPPVQSGHDVAITGTPTGEIRADDEAWIIHVTGRQTEDPDPLIACDIVWAYDLDASAQQIRYNSDPRVNDVVEAPSVVVARKVFGAGDCPEQYGLTDDPRTDIGVQALGPVVLAVSPDGTVTVDGRSIAPGQTMRIEGSSTRGDTTYHAVVTIEALGAWNHEGLLAQ